MTPSQGRWVVDVTVPQNGPELIHYAVHYRDSDRTAPHAFFFQIPETNELFRTLTLPDEVERAWRRDPLGMLSAFRDAVEQLEEQEPSAVSADARRDLSSRETAIILARFLTYPDAAAYLAESGRSAPVQLRQANALSLLGRSAPLFRRFDVDRPGAKSGLYWDQFLGELSNFLSRSRPSEKRQLLERLPESTRQLLRHSERYAADLEKQLVGQLSGVSSDDLYVERAVEARLLKHLRTGTDPVLVLRGEAGFGKSSLLWRLHNQLAAEGATPVLVSAVWIAARGSERLLSVEELIEHVSRLESERLRPVVLLDTADLLLHSEGLIYQTIDLIEQLERLGIQILLTVRPLEASEIPQTARIFDLREYEGDELPRAVTVLMRQYFPTLPAATGLDLVERARTRGFPILTVLRSPLLLRMLFDTSGAEFPGLDYDASALYERYWATRIARDQRGGRVTSERDLGAVASRLGILMLADATPVLTDVRVNSALTSVTYPEPIESAIAGIEELARRGVVVEGEHTWRFVHQALFEFITARALLTRSSGSAATRLVEHIAAHPHDLFTGAVLEQLVILLARDPGTRPQARAVVARLLSESHPSVRQIGVIGWCHVPELAADGVAMDGPTAERVLGHLPQIQSIEADQALKLIEWIWNEHGLVAHRALVDCLGLLIHRWPHAVGAFVIEHKIVDTVLGVHLRKYNQSDSLIALTANLVHTDPTATRRLLLTLVERLPEVRGPLHALNTITAQWEMLAGTAPYAQSVLRAATSAERRFRAHHRDFGVAAGDVLYESMRSTLDAMPISAHQEAWEEIAADAFSRVTTSAPTIADAALLHAIARHLIEAPASAGDHAARVFAHLFGRRPDRGPFHIVGSFLMAVIASESPARGLVADALYDALSSGLPARANHADSPEQWWALTARAALTDLGAPETFIADVVADLMVAERQLWKDPAFLLSAVFPAALGGDARASALLDSVCRDPSTLAPRTNGMGASSRTSPATIEFIERGLEYRDRAPIVAESVLLVAIATRRPGPIATLAASATGADAIRLHLESVRGLIKTMIDGPDIDQRDACTCWKRLQEHAVLETSVNEIAAALDTVRDPQGRASLIEMLPHAVASHVQSAPSALALLRRTVLDDLRAANASTLSNARKRLVDAAFRAYRSILATAASPDGWEPLWDLVRRPGLTGTGTIDTDRFRDVVTFLQNLLRNHPDQTAAVTTHLITAAAWAKTHLSDKQRKIVSDFLANTARRILQSGGEPARRLIDAIGDLPSRLGIAIVTTAIATNGRRHVEALLVSGLLDTDLAAEAVERLRGHREAGFEPIPDLIAPAAR